MTARTAIALATLALVACTDADDEGIVLCVAGPRQINDVYVAFLAGPGGPICQPWHSDGPFDLPECFAGRPGETYDYAMALKVHWGDGCWSEFVVPFRRGRVVESREDLANCPCGLDACESCHCPAGDCGACSEEGTRVFDAMPQGDELCEE
jgi:hypothetical protein